MVIAVQVNGKLRGQIEVPADATRGRRSSRPRRPTRRCSPFIAGKPIKKEIYVKGRLVNLVV